MSLAGSLVFDCFGFREVSLETVISLDFFDGSITPSQTTEECARSENLRFRDVEELPMYDITVCNDFTGVFSFNSLLLDAKKAAF